MIHPLPTLQVGVAPHASLEHGDGVHRLLEPVIQHLRNAMATGLDLDLNRDLLPVQDSDSGHEFESYERWSDTDAPREHRIDKIS